MSRLRGVQKLWGCEKTDANLTDRWNDSQRFEDSITGDDTPRGLFGAFDCLSRGFSETTNMGGLFSRWNQVGSLGNHPFFGYQTTCQRLGILPPELVSLPPPRFLPSMEGYVRGVRSDTLNHAGMLGTLGHLTETMGDHSLGDFSPSEYPVDEGHLPIKPPLMAPRPFTYGDAGRLFIGGTAEKPY